VEIKEKKLGAETRRSRCSLSVAPVGPGPTKIVEETIRFTTAGIEVNLNFRAVWLNSTSMWEITIELLKKKVLEEKFT
jgi:hypothetical protein